MSEVIEALKNLGVEDKEAKVYLACLELGNGTIQEVAEKSGVKRTSIYNILEDMKAKKLVSELKRENKISLIPQDPNDLVVRAEEKVKEVRVALPELLSIYNLPANKPKVSYYQGIEGIKKVYQDFLEAKEDVCGYSDYNKMFEAVDNDWLLEIPKKRAAAKVKFQCIAKDSKIAREIKSRDKEQLRETKLVTGVEFDTEINIYGNKVALISFRRPYVGVIIEDRAIVATMRSSWKLLWDRL